MPVSAELVRPSPAALLGALRPRLTGPAWTLLIDGGSGSGKTTLADWLAPLLRAEVLSMEHLYPGWSGLAAAADLLASRVLPARAQGRVSTWRQWDWASGAPGPVAVLRPGRPLIVEGCGALAAHDLADLGVWIEVSTAERERRARMRDGDRFARHRRAWAEQEARYSSRGHPVARADLVLSGFGFRASVPE